MARLVALTAVDIGALTSESDGLVLIGLKLSPEWSALLGPHYPILNQYSIADAGFSTQTSMVVSNSIRIVTSMIGSISGDTDDVRKYAEAANAAIKKCKAVGIKKPTVVLMDSPLVGTPEYVSRAFKEYLSVTLLGLLESTYEPLQFREWNGKNVSGSINSIRVAVSDSSLDKELVETVEWVHAIDEGRILAKDIGGSDPERMTPLNCAAYIEKAFLGVQNVKVTVTTAPEILLKEYPLLAAVARCSYAVPAHFPAVVRLEYHASDQSDVAENIFLVGKGVTYDTGGADIKTNGHMAGMSRDKCGAAACAGFLKTVSLLKPDRVNVIAELGFVRNSAGPANYVSDEIILSRSGVRVLVRDTDAEGRMVMTDLLSLSKERALSPQYATTPSRLFTVATLTGHAIRAMGVGYNISLDNGPARESGISKRLFHQGHLFADPFETSTLRREDFTTVMPNEMTEDVMQSTGRASTLTDRGHQYPAAFMVIASGLDKHGLDSTVPLSYTHIDIAASAETAPVGLSLPKVTACPIVAFTATFLK